MPGEVDISAMPVQILLETDAGNNELLQTAKVSASRSATSVSSCLLAMYKSLLGQMPHNVLVLSRSAPMHGLMLALRTVLDAADDEETESFTEEVRSFLVS